MEKCHNNYLPITDGIDHINIYSKGQTLVGKMLSNFARTPIEIAGLRFVSVESWWYYKKMKNITQYNIELGFKNAQPFRVFNDADLERVRYCVGADAKFFFRSHRWASDSLTDLDPTEKMVESVFRIKLAQNPHVKQLLENSELPFAHYYYAHGVKYNADNTLYMADIWTKLREELKV